MNVKKAWMITYIVAMHLILGHLLAMAPGSRIKNGCNNKPNCTLVDKLEIFN